ncbi:MAG: DUF4355 domain-containing protein [Prevotellaceae bacterium]|nr:DUF4355 domain-containing protein [Candidatus Faecinaster equi]
MENDKVLNTQNAEPENKTAEEQGQQEAKTYTAEEVEKLLQAESDRRVNQALKTQQKKYEKQLSLAQLDGDAREKAEKDNRIAELEEQLRDFQVQKNKSELKSVLATRGLDSRFGDLLSISDDIETSQSTIDEFDKLFKAAVKAEVEKRLSGNNPKGNGGSSAAAMTKESFGKLSIAEQAKLLSQNNEFYSQFIK